MVVRVMRADAGASTLTQLGRIVAAVGLAAVVATLDGGVALAAWVAVAVAALIVGGSGVRTAITVVAAFFVVAGVAGAFALGRSALSLEDARSALDSVEEDLLIDTEATTRTLATASEDLDDARSSLDAWWAQPARLVPVLAPHIELGSTVVDAADGVIEAAQPLAATDLGDLATLGRLDMPLLESVADDVDELASQAATGREELDALDDTWIVGPVNDQLDEVREEFDEQAERLDRAARFSSGILPHLGADGPERWFILLCTPAEARASCGFPGNWAEIVVDDGRPDLIESGRIRTLEGDAVALGLEADRPRTYVDDYGRFDPVPTLRNITMSPDFPSVSLALADAVEALGRPRPDVVAAVNSEGLEAVLRVTGPVDAGALGVLDTDNVRRVLDVDQYRMFDRQQDRIDALDDATEALFTQVTQIDGLDPEALRRLGEPIESGGLVADVPPAADGTEPDDVFADLDGNGALPDAPVAGVTVQNASGNKIDAFRSVAMELTPATADTAGCATIDISLGVVPPDSPDYIAANLVGLPRGWTRSWVTVFTPTPAEVVRIDGQAVDVELGLEMGRYPVARFMVDNAPDQTVRIELDLEAGETAEPEIVTQPSVEPYTVDLNQECARP